MDNLKGKDKVSLVSHTNTFLVDFFLSKHVCRKAFLCQKITPLILLEISPSFKYDVGLRIGQHFHSTVA
jgi:hypothetical protein